MKFISSSSTSNMNTLTICIFVLCAVLMPYQGAKAQFASGTLGVCSAPGGFACLTTGDTVTPTAGSFAPCVGGVQGVSTPCPGAFAAAPPNLNYICYPGGSEAGTSAGTPCGPDVIGPCLTDGLFSIPGVCKTYYSCATGVKTLVACPAGQEFSPIARICVPTAVAGCSVILPVAPTGPCFPLQREADPTSCRSYYKCSLFNYRIKITCPVGLFYDTTFRLCLPANSCGTRPSV